MAATPRIDSYEFGRIEIDGQAHTSDLIILPTGVETNWWREQGHSLKPSDLSTVLSASPETLVIGQGAHGMMKVQQETLACLRDAGIKAVCDATARAVQIYNERRDRGEAVAAALHLTC